MKLQPYSYCFLRYRQSPENEEFVNIGVAFWAPGDRFLKFRGTNSFSRISNFFGSLDRTGYRILIRHVTKRFGELARSYGDDLLALLQSPENVRALAFQIVPEDDGALRWSDLRGGLTDNPLAEVDRIYEQYIGRFNQGKLRARRDDNQVFQEIYGEAFYNPVVKSVIQRHEVVSPLVSHVFKTAWKNGVWNVYEPLSFDLAEADAIDAKANKWFGRSVHLQQSDERPKIHFLLGKPSDREHGPAYDKAKRILSHAEVTLIEENEVESFAVALREEVARHQSTKAIWS